MRLEWYSKAQGLNNTYRQVPLHTTGARQVLVYLAWCAFVRVYPFGALSALEDTLIRRVHDACAVAAGESNAQIRMSCVSCYRAREPRALQHTQWFGCANVLLVTQQDNVKNVADRKKQNADKMRKYVCVE